MTSMKFCVTIAFNNSCAAEKSTGCNFKTEFIRNRRGVIYGNVI